jgi:hypothetical protein
VVFRWCPQGIEFSTDHWRGLGSQLCGGQAGAVSDVFDEVVRGQAGIITRYQAIAVGHSTATVRARLDSGRWQRIFTGVYATFSGPLPRHSLLWAAVLRAGPGAALSHETAAELAGLVDRGSSAEHRDPTVARHA